MSDNKTKENKETNDIPAWQSVLGVAIAVLIGKACTEGVFDSYPIELIRLHYVCSLENGESFDAQIEVKRHLFLKKRIKIKNYNFDKNTNSWSLSHFSVNFVKAHRYF